LPAAAVGVPASARLAGAVFAAGVFFAGAATAFFGPVDLVLARAWVVV
jgi:hypothetical protein